MKLVLDISTGNTYVEPDCVNECLSDICELGIGYDGSKNINDFKMLIDNMVQLAKNAQVFLRAGQLFCDDEVLEWAKQ